MQYKKHKNPPQLHKQNLSEPRKTGLKEAKHPSKSAVLGAKSALLGVKNNEPATKLERPNGAKCRFFA